MIPAVQRPEHIPPHLEFDFDIFGDPRFEQDVQGSYADAVRNAPDIFWTPKNGGHWIVRRFDDITSVVNDYEAFSAREMQLPRIPDPLVLIPLNMDPPECVPFRMALMPYFSPRAIQGLEARIRELAIGIIEQVAGKGKCDFQYDVSSLFPVSVFMELMGMSPSGLRECRDMADSFFRSRTKEEFEASGTQIIGALHALMAEKRAHPDGGLVSHLLKVDVGGRKMTDDEITRTCFLLFLGGMDTVTNVTGFTFATLAQDSLLQKRLAADASLIPKFVEEGLRCYGVSSSPRVVAKDCERFGIRFKEGEMVLCVLPISGRDDKQVPEPQRFNVDRDKQPHLTFSSGPHLCIGHLLARAEMRIFTEEWVKRIPSFRLQAGVNRGFRAGTVLGLLNLPIEWNL